MKSRSKNTVDLQMVQFHDDYTVCQLETSKKMAL